MARSELEKMIEGATTHPAIKANTEQRKILREADKLDKEASALLTKPMSKRDEDRLQDITAQRSALMLKRYKTYEGIRVD